jgi:hypothetical protein
VTSVIVHANEIGCVVGIQCVRTHRSAKRKQPATMGIMEAITVILRSVGRIDRLVPSRSATSCVGTASSTIEGDHHRLRSRRSMNPPLGNPEVTPTRDATRGIR